MNKNEYKENASKGKTIRTHCNECGKIINHQILMDYCEYGQDILDSDYDLIHGKIDYTADFRHDYQIIKCSGCDTISYRNFYYFSEYQDLDNDGTWEEIFPASIKRKKEDYKYLAAKLLQIYNEVITAYNDGCFILCAAGIRAILEGICKDKGITKGKLDKKIKMMCEKGFVSQQYENILHILRFLGNDVLHELQKPTQEEIEAALDIIEHVIESLYEIIGKAEIIKHK